MGGGGVTVNPSFTGGSNGPTSNDFGAIAGARQTLIGGGVGKSIAFGLLGMAAIGGISAWLIHKS